MDVVKALRNVVFGPSLCVIGLLRFEAGGVVAFEVCYRVLEELGHLVLVAESNACRNHVEGWTVVRKRAATWHVHERGLGLWQSFECTHLGSPRAM